MKRILNINIIIRWFVLVTLISPLPCSGREAVPDELLVDLYSQSIYYPEKLDQYVFLNKHHYDEAFLKCLRRIRDKYYSLASSTLESCERLQGIDEELHTKCTNENTAAQLYLWAAGIEQVLSGHERWENTATGKNVLIAKKYSNTISPGLWNQTQVPVIKAIKPLLKCK